MAIVAVVLAIILAGCTPVPDPGTPARLSEIVNVIRRIIAILAPISALAFFVMLLYGGFKFLTSGGDPKEVAQARQVLTYAILGIILIVAAWLILLLLSSTLGIPNLVNVSFPL